MPTVFKLTMGSTDLQTMTVKGLTFVLLKFASSTKARVEIDNSSDSNEFLAWNATVGSEVTSSDFEKINVSGVSRVVCTAINSSEQSISFRLYTTEEEGGDSGDTGNGDTGDTGNSDTETNFSGYLPYIVAGILILFLLSIFRRS